MSQAATPARSVDRASAAAETAALQTAALQRELERWAWLAIGALAVAGAFALLLALSRVPGMEEARLWPLGFFYKGLVIHVVFSLVIWLLAVFAFLVAAATLDLATHGSDALVAAPLGRIGQGVALVAFPCLFAPAFLSSSEPELTNYVPLIRHPAYDIGLLLLAAGILAPVARLFMNLPGARGKWPPLAFAMAIGGFVYVLALLSFAIAAVLLAREGGLMAGREPLLWGGGHLMSFVYTVVLLANWLILARRALGHGALGDGPFLFALALVGALALPAPLFYLAFPPFSEGQHEAFRLLQFGLAAPTLIIAVAIARALASAARWPWRDPAFFALFASLALFALGGVLGFLVGSYDTRIPAHYHAVVTAVSVASAGMLMTLGLEKVGRPAAPAGTLRGLLALYAGGQFVASIAMFVAGGYGAARKTPTGAGALDAVAAAGMAVHGIASIFTILGGAAFVVFAVRAFARAPVGRGR